MKGLACPLTVPTALVLRPASREDLDEGAISIGVPSFIPIAKSGNSEGSDKPMIGKRTDRLYFMTVQVGRDLYTVHPLLGCIECLAVAMYGLISVLLGCCDRVNVFPVAVGLDCGHSHLAYSFVLIPPQDAVKLEAERAAAKARAAEAAAAAAAATGSLASGISGQSHTTVGSAMHDRELWQLPESIGGLTMGHLLGKGAYGSVYYGTWYSTPVAVKVSRARCCEGMYSAHSTVEASCAC